MYVDLRQSFFALKLKFVKGRRYDTYECKEKKKEHKDKSVVFTETGTDDEEEEVARVTYVINILRSIFSNQQISSMFSNHKQSADLQFQWTTCKQVSHFKQT